MQEKAQVNSDDGGFDDLPRRSPVDRGGELRTSASVQRGLAVACGESRVQRATGLAAVWIPLGGSRRDSGSGATFENQSPEAREFI